MVLLQGISMLSVQTSNQFVDDFSYQLGNTDSSNSIPLRPNHSLVTTIWYVYVHHRSSQLLLGANHTWLNKTTWSQIVFVHQRLMVSNLTLRVCQSQSVSYLWAAPSRCWTRCLCVRLRRCGVAGSPPPASSLSSCSRTEPHRARLPPMAALLLASVSLSQHTRPVAAAHLAAPCIPHLQSERELVLKQGTRRQHTPDLILNVWRTMLTEIWC